MTRYDSRDILEKDALLWGRALAWLRNHVGMTQAEAAEAMGRTAQAWQQWELGKRRSLLKSENQHAVAAALGQTWEALNDARNALSAGLAPGPSQAANGMPTRINGTLVADVRDGEMGRASYAREKQLVDLAPLSGPDIRLIQVAGEEMSPLVEPGERIAFYAHKPPQKHRPCVLALHDGRFIVRRYIRTTDALVIVMRYDCRTLDTGETAWVEVSEQWPLAAVASTHALAYVIHNGQ